MSKPTIESINGEWATGPEYRATDVPHPVWEARTNPEWPRSTTVSSTIPNPLTTYLFRFVLLYIGIQLLPIDGRFFQNLFDFGGGYTHYLFDLSKFAPRFSGLAEPSADRTFTDWGIVALLATVGTLIWTRWKPNATGDETVYNWLRIAVRYRLALAVIAYGFLKLFAIQAPMPSLSNLNTAYGDYSAWKLFSLSLGIVPGYQSFLGAVELTGGLLLLNRKTTVIGTLILLPFLGNVFFSNLAYEGGEYVYSGLLLTFGLFLFAHDAVRLFRLVSLGIAAQPDRSRLVLTDDQRTARLVLKAAFVLLTVGLYGFTTATNGPSRLPQTVGLPGLAGIYQVTEFSQNGQVIPYLKTHRNDGGAATSERLGASARWQDVVFETWNTISIRSNEPARIHHVNTEELPADETARDYELAGSQGRHYYRYTADASANLTLQSANPDTPTDRLTLRLIRQTDSTLVLRGVDAQRDSVVARLTKINKKYLLHEAAKAGRRGSLTL